MPRERQQRASLTLFGSSSFPSPSSCFPSTEKIFPLFFSSTPLGCQGYPAKRNEVWQERILSTTYFASNCEDGKKKVVSILSSFCQTGSPLSLTTGILSSPPTQSLKTVWNLSLGINLVFIPKSITLFMINSEAEIYEQHQYVQE